VSVTSSRMLRSPPSLRLWRSAGCSSTSFMGQSDDGRRSERAELGAPHRFVETSGLYGKSCAEGSSKITRR
jgi:hypothetical protein